MKIHCIIISWDSYFDKASKIAANVHLHVDSLSVVYSNKDDIKESGCGNWIQASNSCFYGSKFSIGLNLVKDDEVLLLIQADAICDDWKKLISRCYDILSSNKIIGVWAPAVSITSWTNKRVLIEKDDAAKCDFVTQTDGIVFAYSLSVIKRLKELDFSNNNLGWGIDWMAICFSYCNNLYVLKDNDVFIKHIAGTGYCVDEANDQMHLFFKQMKTQEIIMYNLLNSYSSHGTTALRTYSPDDI